MKRPVSVVIAGQRYVLRSDVDERSVREMAKYVDAKIKEAQIQSKMPDTQSVVVLAALQIAEELFAVRRREGQLKQTVRDKGQAILEYLERQARV